MSTKGYEWKPYTTYIVAFSYVSQGKTVTGEYVSIEQDPLDALLDARRHLIISYKPGFQLRIAKKITFLRK